jgi:hypothetical protein
MSKHDRAAISSLRIVAVPAMSVAVLTALAVEE